jgi:uncharacterized protein YdhG (YjbR/CyaY superfamily)
MPEIDQYLKNSATPTQKKELNKIRHIAKELAPGSKEAISYGIPTIKYKNKNLIHFAAFKNHMSLFPGARPIEVLGNKLTKFKLSKGTIQFSESNPIPVDLIEQIIKLRIADIDQKATDV